MSNWLQKFNDWEHSVQLSDTEKYSMSLLSSVCLDQVVQAKPKRRSTEITLEKEQDLKVIETTQQFLSWFSKIEQEMNQGQDHRFHEFLDQIQEFREHIQELIQEIEATKNIIEELEQNYAFVGAKTSGLQYACEALLDEQAHMFGISEDIAHKLAYFNQLEAITKQLNMPGDQLVLEPEFGPMLQNLDQCLAFVTDHPTYKDSDLYRMRFRQCMTRAMTLIKLYFVESMRRLQSEIKDKMKLKTAAEPMAANVQLSLFYVKFRSLAVKTRAIIQELELRCPSHPEYFYLLRDCINSYVNVRKALLTPIVTESIKSQETNEIQFAINGCAYMLRVCQDEYALFKEFFSLGEEEVKNYLESFSSLLSYTLRPFILKENRIDILADLCNQLLYMINSKDNQDRLDSVDFVIETILNDTQSRLTFRSQDIIQSEIRLFKPREKELMVLARVPELPQPTAVNSLLGVSEVLDNQVLQGRRSSVLISPSIEAALEQKEVVHTSMENLFGGGEWYPTVQRTMMLLNKLHGCIPAASFDDLAQDAVESCRISVNHAADILKVQMTPADGQLFVIKNLMQLREHISYYDSNFTRSTRNVHISDVFTALKDVLVHPLVLQNYGNLVLPFMQTQVDDVRQLLDADLKTNCEAFILDTAKVNSEPLIKFVKTKSVNGIDSQFTESVKSVANEFKLAVEKHLGNSIRKLSSYLGDKNTQLTLIRIIRSTILNQYNDFKDSVSKASMDLGNQLESEQEIAKIIDDIVQGSLQ